MPYPTKKLGEIAETSSGGTPRTGIKEYWDGDVPWLRSGELVDGEIHKTEKMITERGLKESSAKMFPKNSVLIALTGATVGKTAILRINSATNQSVVGIFPNEKNFVPEFIWYFLRLSYHKIKARAYGGAQPHIDQGDVKNLKIPLPPLQIQKQIVERLDKIVEAQKLNDGLIQKADELFQSLLHKELNLAGKNSEIKKLGDLAELITKGTTPTTYGRQFTNTGTPFLRAEDVNNSVVDFSRVQYHISEETNKFLSRSQTKANDILITIAGTIGRVGYVPENAPMMNMNQAVAIVRLNKITNFMYVFFLLQNKELRRKMFGAQVTGTISNLSLSNIGNLKIPLPPIEMQKQIVAKLSAVQKYKQRLIEQRKKLKELFDSVLRKSMINK